MFLGITRVVTAELSGGIGQGPLLVHHAHAAELLASVCARYDLKNLDIHPEFVGMATGR
jgi:hypothetical protein